MTVLDTLGRDSQVVFIAHALADWLRDPKIGGMAIKVGAISQPRGLMAWGIIAEYVTATRMRDAATTVYVERWISELALDMLRHDSIRRRIAVHMEKMGCPRGAVKAELQRLRVKLEAARPN